MISLLKKKREEGATLLELVMFIGIAALILIGGVIWYQQASDAQRIAEEVSNLNALASLVRNTYTTQNDFDGLSNAVILKSSQFPEKMRTGSNSTDIQSAWERQGVIVESTKQVFDNDSFKITYKGIPERPCLDFVVRTYRFFNVTIGSSSDKIEKVSDINEKCTGESNDVSFVAR